MRILTGRWLKFALISLTAVAMSGCSTYYDKTLVFNNKYEQGEYADARSYLESQKKLKNGKVKVLYDLNFATASFMLDDTQASIDHFAEADRYAEDFSKNYAYEALALVSNPTVRPYELEYFENVLIHFYQALNYIKLSDFEGALVECRRMNLVLDELHDAFRRHDGRRYSRDAFGHLLMAVVYEMAGKDNDAFIAYRNALEIYESDYQPMYGTQIPQCLKRGIIRSAYRTGFAQEGRKYEKKFDITYETSNGKGRLIAFLLDGMSPVKGEVSVDFVKTNGVGFASFSSQNSDFQVPIFWGDCSQSERSALSDFSYIRLTLPQYQDRGVRCQGNLTINSIECGADVVENGSKIAHQSLKDRMWRELGKAILRAATKEAMHQAAAKQNDYIGLLVNIANAVTDKADTRCWTSLPSVIRMVDVELTEGSYEIDYPTCATENATVDISNGKTSVLFFRGF